jgi:hypothetical protein
MFRLVHGWPPEARDVSSMRRFQRGVQQAMKGMFWLHRQNRSGTGLQAPVESGACSLHGAGEATSVPVNASPFVQTAKTRGGSFA